MTAKVNLVKKLLAGRSDPRARLIPLYNSVVARAREPWWYAEAGVPDTLDGRFDMIAALLSLLLIRVEAEGNAGREPAARLTEIFVDDMDGQLRQIGIGDVVVGKHIGRMVSAVGGRLQPYREALSSDEGLEPALLRNLWRGEPGPDARPDLVAEGMLAIAARMAETDWPSLQVQGMPPR